MVEMHMKVNFDEIVERQGTYSAKWMGINGSSLDYLNPAVKLPFQVADMDFACPEPLVQAMHRVADHRVFGYSARTQEYTHAVITWYRRRYGLELKGEWIIPSHGSMSAVNAAIKALYFCLLSTLSGIKNVYFSVFSKQKRYPSSL